MTPTLSTSQQRRERIYLKESHDHFGVNNIRKMQQRQRQLVQEGHVQAHVHSAHDSTGRTNGLVPATHCKAQSLHNKPRELYSEEDKPDDSLDEKLLLHGRTAGSSGSSFATRLKWIFRRLRFGRRLEPEPLTAVPGSQGSGILCSRSSLNSTSSRSRSVSESSSSNGSRRQVHFARETVFSERNVNSPFWFSILEKRRMREQERREMEDLLRPRPFLPFLESGLSYRDDKEFFHLKNSDAHRTTQVLLSSKRGEKSPKRTRCCQVIVKAIRFLFCCPESEEVQRWSGR